jgi:hypothetical protein
MKERDRICGGGGGGARNVRLKREKDGLKRRSKE